MSTYVSGDRVTLEVVDDGMGIAEEDLPRVFDPFFTTKGRGKGTGLGLSITYGIVQEHQGTIACDSAPGQGTRFTLTLPVAARTRAGRAGDAVSTEQSAPRTGTVLVVDDEEIMREILDALLVRDGYEVRLAADAFEGLELARAASRLSYCRLPRASAISTLARPFFR